MRVSKEPAHKVPNLRSGRILPVDPRHVDVSASILYVPHIALGLENSNDGKNGVVGQSWLGRQKLQHLMHGAGALVPETFIMRNSASVRVADLLRAKHFSFWVFDVRLSQTSTNLLVAWIFFHVA